MRIVVVGKGGREHALIRSLSESPSRPELFCFPGSDAIAELAQLVELRFYGGLTNAEVGRVLGVSEPTVERRWRTARVWLRSALGEGAGD